MRRDAGARVDNAMPEKNGNEEEEKGANSLKQEIAGDAGLNDVGGEAKGQTTLDSERRLKTRRRRLQCCSAWRGAAQ
jgi:hypothetical protein